MRSHLSMGSFLVAPRIECHTSRTKRYGIILSINEPVNLNHPAERGGPSYGAVPASKLNSRLGKTDGANAKDC